ncbi:4a-hydroxytetrahydrobiopterin dehydratase [Paeniglutamicibacter antarcticus]|uniref:Putative pterin-4-alpha-carbinolamine dehydratase n=1 Tax=Paeniglutamicibacter antarcticus TaxID=494023 RepID=A0ABP9TP27_9MICC
MGIDKDSPTRVLSDYEIARALKELPSWRERQGALVCAWTFLDSREAIDFLAIVAEAAEHQGHHPDVDWRHDTIFLRTTSHDAGDEITSRDVDLARLLEFAAADSAAVAVPNRHQDVHLKIATNSAAALEGFWLEVMGYIRDPDGVLVDPEGRNPRIRFQQPATSNVNSVRIEKHICDSELEHLQGLLESHSNDRGMVRRPGRSSYSDSEGNSVILCTEVREGTPDFQ